MLSKAQNKYIRSLSHQKYRYEHKVFVVEGVKLAEEWLLSAASIQYIVALPEWIHANHKNIAKHPEAQLCEADADILSTISSFATPNQVVLVVYMPTVSAAPATNEWILALDNIQDPGNMGTLIRIADWFGFGGIVCSKGCVDVYNPKVVQSAMGGHLRVPTYQLDICEYLQACNRPVIVTSLQGSNIYQAHKPTSGVLVIGNESKGVSQEVMALATQQIMIPRWGGAESLNAAVSAGIVAAWLRQP